MANVAHYDDRPGESPPTAAEAMGSSPGDKLISTKELAAHMGASSAWISIEGNVYDVTEFLKKHPGGKGVLLAKCGKDATDEFLRVGHSSSARKRMVGYKIGKLDMHASRPVGTRCPFTNKWTDVEGGSDIGEGDLDVDVFSFNLKHAAAFFGGPVDEIPPMKGVKWPALDPQDRYPRGTAIMQEFMYVLLLSWEVIPRCRVINLVVWAAIINAAITFAYNLVNYICGQSIRATYLLHHMSQWETHLAGLCSVGALCSGVLIYDDVWGLLQSQLCAIAFYDLIVYPSSLVAASHSRIVLAQRLLVPGLLFIALCMKVYLLGFMTPMRALVCALNGLLGACYMHSAGAKSETPLRESAITISAALQLVVGYFLLSFIDLTALLGASLAQPSQLVPEDVWVSMLHTYSTWKSLAVGIIVAYLVVIHQKTVIINSESAAGPVSLFNMRYLFQNLIFRMIGAAFKTVTWKYASFSHFVMASLQCAGVWQYQQRVLMGSYEDIKARVQEPLQLENAGGMLAWLLLLRATFAHMLSHALSGLTELVSWFAHPEMIYYFHPTPLVNFRRRNVDIGIAYSVTPMDEQRKPTVFQCNVGFMEGDYDWMATNRFTYKMVKQLSSDPHAGKKGFVADFVAEFRTLDRETKKMKSKQVNLSAWTDARSSTDWYHASKAHKEIVTQFQNRNEGGKLNTFGALLAHLEAPQDKPLRWVVRCHKCFELVHGYPENKECPKCGRDVSMPFM